MEDDVTSAYPQKKKSKGALIVSVSGIAGLVIGIILSSLGVPGVSSVNSAYFFAGIGAFIGLIIVGIMKVMGKLPNEPSMTSKQKKSWWIFWGIVIAIAIWVGIMLLFHPY